VRINVLGPLEVLDGPRVHTPKTPKLRTVLALLLMNPNANVSTETFIEELWGYCVPRSAAGTLQTYIYQLRKILHGLPGADGGGTLVTKPAGYQLQVGPDQLDAFEFESLAREGRQRLLDGDAESASTILRRALRLWRGRTLAGVECGSQLSAYVARLEENRLNVLEHRIDADMRTGRHRELIGELKSLVATYPLHEWFYARLIMALHLSGRRAEALSVYQTLRHGLREELGLDPTIELQQIHRAVLTGSMASHLQRLGQERVASTRRVADDIARF
jgi:DNA-binding SARP family transcriptional activator